MARTTVIIIGGGLASLHGARLLRAAQVDFVLLEARARPGGRILSTSVDGQPADDGFDLGPSRYWPQMQRAIAEIISETGMQSVAQHSDGVVVFERFSREGQQCYHCDPSAQSAAQFPPRERHGFARARDGARFDIGSVLAERVGDGHDIGRKHRGADGQTL